MLAESFVKDRNTSSSDGRRSAMSVNSMFAVFNRDNASTKVFAPPGAGIAIRSAVVVRAALFSSGKSEPSASAIAGRSLRSRGTISQ
jgi:hypothetical protein